MSSGGFLGGGTGHWVLPSDKTEALGRERWPLFCNPRAETQNHVFVTRMLQAGHCPRDWEVANKPVSPLGAGIHPLTLDQTHCVLSLLLWKGEQG